MILKLRENLEKITMIESGYERQRDYISLSHISECPAKIYRDFKNGYPEPDISTLLKCHKGYQEEKDLKDRLKKCYPEYIETKEISIHGGLFKGHTDGELNGCLIEIKSFARDEYIPIHYDQVSFRIKCQIQAYLKFGNYATCYLIMESRESGRLSVIEVRQQLKIIASHYLKILVLKNAVETGKMPGCLCGKCSDN